MTPPKTTPDAEARAREAELYVQPSLQGYYIGYLPTGSAAIDAILGTIAYAGKAYHSTEYWGEQIADSGISYDDNIQNAANVAAAELAALKTSHDLLANEAETLRNLYDRLAKHHNEKCSCLAIV